MSAWEIGMLIQQGPPADDEERYVVVSRRYRNDWWLKSMYRCGLWLLHLSCHSLFTMIR
jgi:hypothetical protein